MKFVGSFVHRIAPLLLGVESNLDDSPTSTSDNKGNDNAAKDRAVQYAKRKGLVPNTSQGR